MMTRSSQSSASTCSDAHSDHGQRALPCGCYGAGAPPRVKVRVIRRRKKSLLMERFSPKFLRKVEQLRERKRKEMGREQAAEQAAGRVGEHSHSV